MKITAYKAFNPDMTCKGQQYAIGQTYEFNGVPKLCKAGFHACEAPLDIWNYYPVNAPAAVVELDGVTGETENDTKRVGNKITIKAALTIPMLIAAQIEWTFEKAKENDKLASGASSTAASSGNYSTAASSGNYSTAASSGDSSTAASSGGSSTAASSGDSSTAASSGYSSKAASSGYSSTAASSGDSSTAASSGDSSTATSSGDSSTAASSGNYSTATSSGDTSKAASSGDSSTAASSGDSSTAASSGNYSTAEAKGEKTIAVCAGLNCLARAGIKGAFAIPWLDAATDSIRIAVGVVGENADPDTWYKCNSKGELVKA